MYIPTIFGLKPFDELNFAFDLPFASRAAGTYNSPAVDVSEFAEYLAIFLMDNTDTIGSVQWRIQESNDNAVFNNITGAGIVTNESGILSKMSYVDLTGSARKKFIRIQAVLSGATESIGALSLRMSPLGGKLAVPGGSVRV